MRGQADMAEDRIDGTVRRHSGGLCRWLLASLLLCIAGLALAQTDFPPLTGRVVDQANLLDEAEEASLVAQLEAHEQETSHHRIARWS